MIFGFVTVGVVHAYHDTALQLDSPPMEILVSPQCRQNALQVLNGNFGHALGGRFCQLLSYTQMQLLALELTKCHLEELQQDIFENPCSLSVHECLAHLTPLGFQSYTMFKINVEQYCFKLNHELMILQQQETGVQLQHTAKLASQQIAELIERQGEIKSDYAQLLSSLREQQMDLHHSLFEQAIELQHVSEQQLFEWTKEMMKGQTQQMMLQQEQLQDLSNVVGKTAAKIKSALNLDSVLSLISGGMKVANMFAYMYATVHIQWLLTLPRCVRSCRGKLWGLAMVEFVLMSSFVWCNEDSTTSASEQFMQRVRFYSLSLQGFIYLLTFLSSFFSKEPLVDGDQHRLLIASLESLKDSVKEMRVVLDEREDRLGKLLRDQHFDIQRQIIHQDRARRHVGTTVLNSMREMPFEQAINNKGWPIHAYPPRDIGPDTNAVSLIPSRHPGEVEQSYLVHPLLASHVESSPLPARLHADTFFDATEDPPAVTPSPQRCEYAGTSEEDVLVKKRPLSSIDEIEPPSKKHCGGKSSIGNSLASSESHSTNR
jgi:hypothetical protein